MVTIKAKPTTYFYSDSIYLTTGRSLQLSEKAMSLTELQDTIEGYDAKHLEVSDEDISKIRAEYLRRRNSGGGGSNTAIPSTVDIIDDVSKSLDTTYSSVKIEDMLKNRLRVDEVMNLSTIERKRVAESLGIPTDIDFVATFRAQID